LARFHEQFAYKPDRDAIRYQIPISFSLTQVSFDTIFRNH
jgi:hypothetical protein